MGSLGCVTTLNHLPCEDHHVPYGHSTLSDVHECVAVVDELPDGRPEDAVVGQLHTSVLVVDDASPCHT